MPCFWWSPSAIARLLFCVWMAVLDVPLFFIFQSVVDSGLYDVVSIQRDFRDPLDHAIEIHRNFRHVVPSRARFTAHTLLTKVTILPLNTCSRSSVSAIRMNGSDGGHESWGPGPTYTPAAHPQSVHTSFTPSHSLSSAPTQELHDLRRAAARSSSPPVTFSPQAGFIFIFFFRDLGNHFRHTSSRHGSRITSLGRSVWSRWELSKVIWHGIRYAQDFGR
jgi:hypothetical protein